MSGIVLTETPYIREAILESEPVSLIASVCEGDLIGKIFNHKSGGFVGGDLLNVMTAAFACMRQRPGEPVIEKPVAYPSEPKSFIGRLVVNLLNGSLDSDGQGTSTIRNLSGSNEGKHFCNQAEIFYANEAAGTRSMTRRPMVILDRSGEIILYRKGKAAYTALLVGKDGISAGGVWLPPGVICDYGIVAGGEMISRSGLDFGSIDDVFGIAPFRISAFAVPEDERAETFEAPAGRLLDSLSAAHLERYGDMQSMRRKFSKRVAGHRLSRMLSKARLLGQELTFASS